VCVCVCVLIIKLDRSCRSDKYCTPTRACGNYQTRLSLYVHVLNHV